MASVRAGAPPPTRPSTLGIIGRFAYYGGIGQLFPINLRANFTRAGAPGLNAGHPCLIGGGMGEEKNRAASAEGDGQVAVIFSNIIYH